MENFANSCRREDKMRTEGGRDIFEKEEEGENLNKKSELSGYGVKADNILRETILIPFLWVFWVQQSSFLSQDASFQRKKIEQKSIEFEDMHDKKEDGCSMRFACNKRMESCKKKKKSEEKKLTPVPVAL